jgi:hypothetical protein
MARHQANLISSRCGPVPPILAFALAGRPSFHQFTGANPQALAAKPFVNAANCAPISRLDEENEKGTLFSVRS